MVPAHWEGYGFDRAGVLRGYKVEVYRYYDGKYLYATDYKFEPAILANKSTGTTRWCAAADLGTPKPP